jgi:CrcB protein
LSIAGKGRAEDDSVTYLWVAAGGALGSIARFWLTIVMTTLVGSRFPWGTLLINVVGSFVIGWFMMRTGSGAWRVPEDVRTFVTVGICGGFTTFSSFSLQTLELVRAGQAGPALMYVLGSVALCLLSVWAGLGLGRVGL